MKNVFDIRIFQSVIIVTQRIPNIKVLAPDKEALILFNAAGRVLRELTREENTRDRRERESAVAA